MRTTALTFTALWAIAGAIAQPTITTGSLSFVPGDQYMRSNCDSIDPGPAGPAQNWDLSGLTGCGAPITHSWIAPILGSDPYITVVQFDAGYIASFYHAGSSAFELLATTTDQQNDATYTDPVDLVHYPMSYMDSFTDVYSGVQTIQDSAHTVIGTHTVTYDGWGSLTVPWGTVPSVYRLHSHDSVVVVGLHGYTEVADVYEFIQPGLKEPIVRARTAFYNGSFSFHYGQTYLYLPGSIGMIEADPANAFMIFPNPSTASVTISTAWSSIDRLELIDATGRVVYSSTHLPGQVTLELRDRLPPGCYQVSIRNGGFTTLQRFIIS